MERNQVFSPHGRGQGSHTRARLVESKLVDHDARNGHGSEQIRQQRESPDP